MGYYRKRVDRLVQRVIDAAWHHGRLAAIVATAQPRTKEDVVRLRQATEDKALREKELQQALDRHLAEEVRHHSDLVARHGRLCLFCRHFDMWYGEGSISEDTPGDDTEAICLKNVFPGTNVRSQEQYLQLILTAEDCEEFEVRDE